MMKEWYLPGRGGERGEGSSSVSLSASTLAKKYVINTNTFARAQIKSKYKQSYFLLPRFKFTVIPADAPHYRVASLNCNTDVQVQPRFGQLHRIVNTQTSKHKTEV